MKRIVLCDDSRAWLAKASEILNKYIEREGRDTEVLCFDEPAKCIEGMPADTEAVFMDIEWEKSPEGAGDAAAVAPESARKAEPEGIAAAAEINQRYPGCRVIYLTNHLGYALDVYYCPAD